MSEPFWKSKTLAEMSAEEWESLCDGCALCCLQKLEDEDTGKVYYTRVACRYLDGTTCRCTAYPRRLALVPDCVRLTPQHIDQFSWLPNTCAYRLLAAGKPLYRWHPLLSGCPESVHRAGISVKGKTLPETSVHPQQWQDHLIDWVEVD